MGGAVDTQDWEILRFLYVLTKTVFFTSFLGPGLSCLLRSAGNS